MIRSAFAITLFALGLHQFAPAAAGGPSLEALQQQALEQLRQTQAEWASASDQSLRIDSFAAHLQAREVALTQVEPASGANAGLAPLAINPGKATAGSIELAGPPPPRRVIKEFEMPYFSFGRLVRPPRTAQP